MKTKILKNACKALACFTLVFSLTACGNSGDISKSKEPVTAHDAFNSESIWFKFRNKGIVDKEGNIEYIFSFDGKGKVTAYNPNDLTFAGLKELENDDIIKLAKEQDKANFDSKKEKTLKEFQETIDKIEEYHELLKSEYDNKTYKEGLPEIEKELPIFPVLSDAQIIAKHEDKLRQWYETKLKTDESKLDLLNTVKEKINAIEYKEPKPVEFSLSGKTDKSGNIIEKETIKFDSYKYFEQATTFSVKIESVDDDDEILKLSSEDFIKKLESEAKEANSKFSWDIIGYVPHKIDFDLVPADIDAQPVYDMLFRGYVDLMTKVDKGQAGFILDTPDTKGIEIDKE